MSPNKPILLAVCYFLINSAFATNPNPAVKQLINQKDWNFTENKGQVASPDIKYYGHQGGVYLYCKPGTISFVFTKTEKDENISEATGPAEGQAELSPFGGGRGRKNSGESNQFSKITTNRADLVLLNSDPNAEILASDKQEYYENYYTTGDANRGITNVHNFKTVTYKSVYPNIDMVLHSRESGMKYEFVVHPGGKVSDIQMQWNGLQNMQMTQDGGIKYAMALGEMSDGKPLSFQEGNKIIKSSFRKDYNRIGFQIASYNRNTDLVIDPSLIWASYYGGSNLDVFPAKIAVDKKGNIYMVSGTGSSSSVASSGAYQTTNAGSYDAFLVNFNSNGSRKWATYYGGQDDDYGSGIVTDDNGYIYITGNTNSRSGIATSGAYQTQITSQSGFLAKFNSAGQIQYGTYTGIAFDENIAIDLVGNIYLFGATIMKGLATSGAYQTSIVGGFLNDFLGKFTNNGFPVWGTYFGGINFDQPSGVATDNSGNVYITGYAQSSGLATNGAYQTYIGLSSNAFIAKFDSGGAIKWSTYFGHYNSCQGNDLKVDPSGNVYITGWVISDPGVPFPTIGAYKTFYYPSTTNGDAFLTKFDTYGNLIWATYYGGPENDAGMGITLDGLGNVYIVGITNSSSGISTSDAYQKKLSADSDAFIAKFSTGGGLQSASYFGGNGVDYGFGIASDDSGNVYIAGVTGSTSGIATSGAFQTSNSNIDEAFTVKSYFKQTSNDAGILGIGNQLNNFEFCAGTPLTVNLTNYGSNTLTKVNISWSVNNILQKTFSWTGSLNFDSVASISLGVSGFVPGTDTIRAWTSKPNGQIDSMPGNDTNITIFIVDSLPGENAGPNKIICKGNIDTLGPIHRSDYFYAWRTTPTGSFFSGLSNPVVSPDTTTTYYLVITTQRGCQKYDSTKIIVKPPTHDAMILYSNTCPGDSTPFSDTSTSSKFYSWSFGDGSYSSLQNPKHLYASNGSYNVNLKVSNSYGCTDSISKYINITNCVWPGDANDDKVVDMKDFLAVGIAFGDTSLPRPSANISWTGQPCPDWNDTIPGGINAKYSDCDGDSIVNYFDTIAISKNYGLSHTKSSPLIQGNSSDPGFVITPLSDSVSIGKIFQASISMGNQKNPVQNLYGMAFTVSADPSLFEIDKATIKIIPSFFGTDSIDLMGLKINNNSNSSFDLGLTRIDHKNTSGYGSFAILSIPVKATISQKNIKTALSVSNNTQISFNGKNIPLYFSSDSVVVTQHTSGINPVSQFLSGINIYPNPFSSTSSVQYTLLKPSKILISLFDLTGKEIGIIQDGNQQIGNYSLDINAEKYHLTPGVYMLKFITGDGYVSRKIVKF